MHRHYARSVTGSRLSPRPYHNLQTAFIDIRVGVVLLQQPVGYGRFQSGLAVVTPVTSPSHDLHGQVGFLSLCHNLLPLRDEG